jgi:hypothetical protein
MHLLYVPTNISDRCSSLFQLPLDFAHHYPNSNLNPNPYLQAALTDAQRKQTNEEAKQVQVSVQPIPYPYRNRNPNSDPNPHYCAQDDASPLSQSHNVTGFHIRARFWVKINIMSRDVSRSSLTIISK